MFRSPEGELCVPWLNDVLREFVSPEYESRPAAVVQYSGLNQTIIFDRLRSKDESNRPVHFLTTDDRMGALDPFVERAIDGSA